MEELVEKKVETGLIKCESCGANMIFEPQTQTLVCPHCGTNKKFEINGAEEIDINSAFLEDQNWSEDEVNSYLCANCGAKIVLSKGATADVCPFCGTAHAIKKEELTGLKPSAVVPFKFDVSHAEEVSKEWAKKRAFTPNDFKKHVKAENIKGVYTPCFTFDSVTTSVYSGRIGTHHTRTVGSGKNRRVETYTTWQNISGVFYHNFDDVLITAGNKFDQKKLDKLSPFETNDSASYQENFLYGYMAYRYDKEIKECWADAKTKMDSAIKSKILSQYHYDVVAYLNVSTSHNAVTYKYVMLPVYVGSFNYKKKLYNYYLNGETGKIYGKTPKSPLKIFFTVFSVLAVVGTIIGLIVGGVI